MNNRIAVIGGGASGLMSAVCAARRGAQVTVYERLNRVGKKLLATGNGRCNLTNAGAGHGNYHGSGAALIDEAARCFWVEETLEFFSQLGLVTKCEEEGKVYPYSDQASSVLDVLRFELERLNVRTVCGFEVKNVKKYQKGFELLSYDGRRETADKVIIACGGKAAPDLGSNGSGYDIVKGLGHTVTELRPSLVQLRTKPDIVKPLKGIKVQASVKYGGHEAFGEVLFTDYGISGPPVFSLSPYCTGGGAVLLDIMPEYSLGQTAELIAKNAARGGSCENIFVGILNKRVGMQIVKSCGIGLSEECAGLSENNILKLAERVKRLCLEVTGTQSWNNAQVTAGGVPAAQVNGSTLESLRTSGIYITGELLDIDGDCGGYNLQWAWTSGYIAGAAAAR